MAESNGSENHIDAKGGLQKPQNREEGFFTKYNRVVVDMFRGIEKDLCQAIGRLYIEIIL